jgi:hypothetical protein
VTITDPAAPTNTATAHSKATVGDGSLTAKPSNVQGRVAGVATSATPASGVVTTFTDAKPGGTSADYSATIDWGDGTTTQGAISGPSTGAGPRQVSGTHTYYEDFNYTVKTTIRDRGGAQTTVSSIAFIDDPANPVEAQLEDHFDLPSCAPPPQTPLTDC